MSVVLPAPVPLPHPAGHPVALADAADGLAGAGFLLGLVTVRLAGPEVHAPQWLGADASSAAAQVGATRQTASATHDAVTTAAALLSAHRETLVAARARIEGLRVAQEGDFADAELRLATLVDPAAQLSSVTEDPAAAALVARLTEAEADRAAEHAELLRSVDEDGEVAGAALTAAAAGLGGTGHTGPAAAEAVQLHLSAVLPGHGTTVLMGWGRTAADELRRPGTAEDLRSTLLRYADVLADPTVAASAVVRLGPSGLQQLLLQADGDDVVAGVLAAALTAAVRGGRLRPAAGSLVDTVLDAEDPDAVPDAVAIGLGAVLAAPGAGAELAARWLPPLLAREQVQGVRATDQVSTTSADPVTVALELITGSGRADLAAEVLGATPAWDRLLAREWADEGAALVGLVTLAGRAEATAEGVVTAALRSVGPGLLPGAEGVVTASPTTWARVAPELAGILAAHPDALVAPLAGPGAPGAAGLLSGAAFLLMDPRVQQVVVPAVEARVLALGPAVDATAVVGALVAVQDQAGAVAWLVGCAVALDVAIDRQLCWFAAVTLPLSAFPGPVGSGLQATAGVAATLFGFDGTPDRPDVRASPLGAGWAASRSLQQTGTPGSAVAAYEQVTGLLALPPPPALPTDPYATAWPVEDLVELDREQYEQWRESAGGGRLVPR